MRITQTYERFGYFWLPADPSRKVPGTLSVSDGGNISLELNGVFEGGFLPVDAPDEFRRIVGELEKDGYITLDDCFYKSRSLSFGGFGKSSLHAHRALVGLAYEENEEELFHRFSFSIEGLDEWVAISGITVDYKADAHEAVITFKRPEPIAYSLLDGIQLRIEFAYTLPGLPANRKASVSQRTYFRLESERARPITDFMEVAHKLTTFLCLATDETVCLRDVSAASEDIRRPIGDGDSYPMSVQVYYASLPFRLNATEVSPHRMLFRLPQITDRAQEILGKWIDAWDRLGPSLALYFSAVADRHETIDTKFLSLAQGIEAFHRRTTNTSVMAEGEFGELLESLIAVCPDGRREWLRQKLAYANEVSLATRLKSIIAPFSDHFGPSSARSRLVRKIVDTRNYLTHYDRSLEARAAKGTDLLNICYLIEVLFRMHILLMIGFTVEEVARVFDNSYRLKQKLALVAEI